MLTAPEFGFTEILFARLNRAIAESNRFDPAHAAGPRGQLRFGEPGLHSQILDEVEAALTIKLPDDLRIMMQIVADPGCCLLPDRSPQKQAEIAEWVKRGIRRDVENGLWLNSWGNPEETAEGRAARFSAEFPHWPRLVSVYGHRFLPIEPCRPGNPLFSIMQSDIVVYGANLANWLEAEFLGPSFIKEPERDILIWSDFAFSRGISRN
jgi:hypothetical protein